MTVELEKQGKVTVVTINRPNRKNAVNRSTAEDLAKAFKQIDEDSDTDSSSDPEDKPTELIDERSETSEVTDEKIDSSASEESEDKE